MKKNIIRVLIITLVMTLSFGSMTTFASTCNHRWDLVGSDTYDWEDHSHDHYQTVTNVDSYIDSQGNIQYNTHVVKIVIHTCEWKSRDVLKDYKCRYCAKVTTVRSVEKSGGCDF